MKTDFNLGEQRKTDAESENEKTEKTKNEEQYKSSEKGVAFNQSGRMTMFLG